MSHEMIREDIRLMEASGTRVFFRYTTTDNRSGKTDTMEPVAARNFLDVAEGLGLTFTYLRMDRAENF